MMRIAIPPTGQPQTEVLEQLAAMKSHDTDWRGGRVFSLVYHANAEHEELLRKAHALYASANLLNPIAFQSLKRMESEVVQMAASLFHGPGADGASDGAVGCMTSGGTESILVAVQNYRDRA